MPRSKVTVLVVGATGSIGRLVVEEALRQGHAVRAFVRSEAKARQLPQGAKAVIGDVTHPETLVSAVEGGGKAGSESVDYGGVRNVLRALGSRPARIALMTAIGVTNRTDHTTAPPKRTTGSGGRRGSFALADCLTRSCDQDGLTTTLLTSINLSFCRWICYFDQFGKKRHRKRRDEERCDQTLGQAETAGFGRQETA
jgi:hypothetical protein